MSGAFGDEVGDGLNVVGDFGQEDDVGTGGDAGVQGDPTGVAAHDLDDHGAMV